MWIAKYLLRHILLLIEMCEDVWCAFAMSSCRQLLCHAVKGGGRMKAIDRIQIILWFDVGCMTKYCILMALPHTSTRWLFIVVSIHTRRRYVEPYVTSTSLIRWNRRISLAAPWRWDQDTRADHYNSQWLPFRRTEHAITTWLFCGCRTSKKSLRSDVARKTEEGVGGEHTYLANLAKD